VNIGLTMLSQAVAFAIFIWFTIKFVWPPLMRAIEQRQKQISEGLAAAERGKQAVVEEAKNAAKVEAERIVTGAKAEIEQEVFRAKEALRTQVAALAVTGAEKILRREVDAKAHAQLLSGLEAELR
jgi:F-type H+-transporting ATPase subunit b